MSTEQTTLGTGEDPADVVDDAPPERDPTEDLQGYALALWDYGQLHDDPAWTDAARYALREDDS